MKRHEPSRTAFLVSLLRALADRGHTSVSLFRDPTAYALLPPRWARAFHWLEPAFAHQPAAARRLDFLYMDTVPLRTLAIDRELSAAVEHGCAQVVILGAGLDGRAYRMPQLAASHVFEVDHPATQPHKQQRAAALPRACRELSFVPVDFERDSLSAKLEQAGHRPDQPTVWLCEGVSMYLGDESLTATLSTVAARSCAGSRLLLEYHDVNQPTTGWFVQRIMLRLWSEPQIGLRSREHTRALVERAGFNPESDSGGADWAATFGAAPPSALTKRQRVLVARRAARGA